MAPLRAVRMGRGQADPPLSVNHRQTAGMNPGVATPEGPDYTRRSPAHNPFVGTTSRLDAHTPGPHLEPDLPSRIASLKADAERADAEGDPWWRDRLLASLAILTIWEVPA